MYQLATTKRLIDIEGDVFFRVAMDGQTDRILESSYGNISAPKKLQLKAQN